MSKTEETFDYEFRLFDLRKKVLGRLENEVRDCSNVDHLFDVKWDLSDMIERETIPRKKPPEKIANEFRTSFETAIEMLFENSDRRILIQDSDFYPNTSDGEIKPNHISGTVEEMILSYKNTDENGKINLYPVYLHNSSHRICSCPAQRYSMLCPHTIARLIERNWRW